jgi:acylphosphatase
MPVSVRRVRAAATSGHDGRVAEPTDRAVTDTAVDVTVTGRVQGVSFRYWTEEQARRLGVTGWVRNEPDGSVAVHAEGPQQAVDALVEWCREGPRLARVQHVAVREGAPTGATRFETRY